MCATPFSLFDYSSAEDLGLAVWEHAVLAPPEVVQLADFSGQFAWATINHQGVDIWVTMSLSHVSCIDDIFTPSLMITSRV